MAPTTEFRTVGKNVTKVDGLQLACGKAEFVDDVDLVGTLQAKILASPHAHARIKKIRTKKAEAVPGVKCILHYGNVPRIAHTTAGQGYPEPSPYDNFMFDDKVRFVGDRVALVAAETLEAAEEACRLIEVDYEVLPAILDPEKSMLPGAPILHDEKDADGIFDATRNIAGHIAVEVGNVEQGERECDGVVSGKYYSHYAQHCPLEPHVVLSYLDGNNRLVIRASTQVPFHARRIVAMVLQIPVHRVRIIKPRIGGGFGAKQEVFLEYLVGAVTLRTGRPCKLEFTRSEEFISSRTRHPHVMWMKIGAKKDGTIHLLDLKALSNTGAYGTHSLTVVCNAGSKALPMYNKAPHVKFWADAVYTNMPVGGAYRGYGGTQGFFAEECEIDELAEKLGMDALELRRKNHIREGETSPVFKALGEGREGFEQVMGSCKLGECIDIGAREIGWTEKRGKKRRDGAKVYGVGCAILMQGSGIPGIDMGAATIKLNEDGSFNLNIGATDLGTGADTVLAQIAAEALSVPVEKFIITAADTDTTPFDTGAYASSTTYISGGAVKKTADIVRAQILEVASEILNVPKDQLRIENGVVFAPSGKKLTYGQICDRSLYSRNQHQIMAEASHISYSSPPPFSAHFAEVEVDTETGMARVVKYVAATDCGTAIHPALAEGQSDGAILNGITYALTEEYVFNSKGRMLNPTFADYKIYTSSDMPEIKTILVPSYEPTGPFGAKSIAEININGPLPAISNAIKDAVGVRMRYAPFTPEKLLRAMKGL